MTIETNASLNMPERFRMADALQAELNRPEKLPALL